jgi:hypothetical protein
MSTDASGGCLCGQIRYRITGTPLVTSLCHCRSCRRAAGAPAVAWVVVRRDELVFEQGAPTAYASSPGIERTFCPRCGTPLTYRRDDSPESIDVQTATLDTPDAFPPTREIWLEHRIAWMVTNDQLAQYPRTSREQPAVAPAEG